MARAGRWSQSARPATRPSAWSGRPGYANAATRLSPERSASGTPAPAMSTASSGFPDGLGSRDVVDRSGDVIGERRHGRHEERDHRIDVRVVQQQPESVRIRLGGRSSGMSTGFARLASRQERRQRHACLLGQLRQLQACGVAGIGAQNSEPTGIREHGHPAPRGSG